MIPVLVTGGAGYIGSHTCKLLHSRGYLPVVYDNLTTGHADAVRWGPLVQGDVRDAAGVAACVRAHRVEAVIHFAASAYVGESVAQPQQYYDNNVGGMIGLLGGLAQGARLPVVFSSSCAVYGIARALPLREDMEPRPISPYGWTKLIGEQMLADHDRAHGLPHAALRYFNAAGADPDGELCERHDPETHLVPRAIMAAAGRVPALTVYGSDYPTTDGTCRRDYIHVADLAEAHVRALDHLRAGGPSLALNIGSGTAHSVREVLAAVEGVTGRAVPVSYAPRRPGDPPALYADPGRARATLGFETRHSDLGTIIRTAARAFGFGEQEAA